MLVPAMAFAWWLVSFPSPAAATAAVVAHDRAAAEMQAQGNPQDHASQPSPAALQAQRAYASAERVMIKVVTPDIVREAESFLGVAMRSKMPIGAEHEVTIDDQRYVLRIEWHYHPPGFVGAPNGWHHGVTVYALR